MRVTRLAKAFGITAARLNDIVRGRRGSTAGTAPRNLEFWLGLQLEYDLRIAEAEVRAAIDRQIAPRKVA